MLESLEYLIDHVAGSLTLILEGISVFCILVGLLTTLQLAAKQRWSRYFRKQPTAYDPELSLDRVRLNFGLWLSLALEFQLGADIANTTVAPSLEALGKLALLAVIRTFLNVFLARELEAEKTAIHLAQQP
ncbi:DUF1622 domain-containing protein [Leptolyngbya sp. CCNP1308]|uniref:DUF1622 domain-containing protein n=1 Tax=Leptolyngbya sp. CCNP1308 TaxID=3110255 RepID=UPI002B20B076|nr:DUF1622 domain-containing protein [Leptolyngbya sp. CCNP1308]MEA5448039.1 DUF1622 domain-containing protein [Leptolyngbya sp. CCNP1308]